MGLGAAGGAVKALSEAGSRVCDMTLVVTVVVASCMGVGGSCDES